MSKHFLIILPVFLAASLAAQKIITLYNGAAPGSENWNWKEKEFFVKEPLNANVAYNITNPTLTLFKPDSSNGCAVIICPGGGFHVLNIENEGYKIARELNKKGITAFVFKYRVVQSLTEDPWLEMRRAMANYDSFLRKVAVVRGMAKTDLNRALVYLRQHAAELLIDPARVGVIGFSGGGALSANLAYNFTADARPDFVASLYSVITSIETRQVKPDAPPLFIAAATDDQMAPVSNSITLYNDWMNAQRPVELHIYAKGGHGLWGVPARTWISRFGEWLEAQGLLKPGK